MKSKSILCLPVLLLMLFNLNAIAQGGPGNHGNPGHPGNHHPHPCRVNLGPDLTVCPGKNLTLDAGHGFQSYLWSDSSTTKSITVSTGGTYSVTVTGQDSCTAVDTIVITVDSNALKLYVHDRVALSCAHPCESVTANIRNGTPPYTVVWSNGDSTPVITVCDTTASVYTVTATDTFGCTNTDTVNVSYSGSILVSLGNDRYINCGTRCVRLNARTANCSAALTYAWSNGNSTRGIWACDTVSTTYSVTVTDDSLGCTGSDTVNVIVSDSLCGPDRVLVCHSFGSNRHVTLCIPAQDLQAHLDSGDVLGCCDSNAIVHPFPHHYPMHLHSGDDDHDGNHFLAQPNPFSDKTTIQYSMAETNYVSVEVYNSAGVKVSNLFSGKVDANKIYSVDFVPGDLPPGIYIYKVTTESGNIYHNKLFLLK